MSIELTNYIFLVLATPFAIWSAWSDLKYMKIPNILVLLMAGAFVVSGPFLLDFDIYLWRLFGGFIVLVIGFVLFSIGGFGGGDAKFGAAMALFVDHTHIASFLLLLAMFALLGVVTHRIVGMFGFMSKITDTWESWRVEKTGKIKNFPLGLGMSAALIFYQLSVVELI
jgi:prepilin peptidase CpaA